MSAQLDLNLARRQRDAGIRSVSEHNQEFLKDIRAYAVWLYQSRVVTSSYKKRPEYITIVDLRFSYCVCRILLQ